MFSLKKNQKIKIIMKRSLIFASVLLAAPSVRSALPVTVVPDPIVPGQDVSFNVVNYSPTQTIPDGTGILAVFANINDPNDLMNTTLTGEPIVGPSCVDPLMCPVWYSTSRCAGGGDGIGTGIGGGTIPVSFIESLIAFYTLWILVGF